MKFEGERSHQWSDEVCGKHSCVTDMSYCMKPG
jgi:hypothetical protein